MSVVGPANSGKRHLGKILAHEEHVPFIEISLKELGNCSVKEIEELSKDLSELKKAVVFLADSEILNITKVELNNFLEQLKQNKGLTILLSSKDQNPNIKTSAEIMLEPLSTEIYKEILNKHASHLNDEGKRILAKEICGMSVNDVIELCKYVEMYWKEHYMSTTKVRAPLKLYLSIMEQTIK